MRFDVGHHAQGAVEPADIPVGLRPSGDLIGRERPEEPDRVDRDESADEGDDAEHDEEEAAGLGHVHRHQRVADDVVVGATRPGELRVLLRPHHHEVDGDKSEDQARDQQDVDCVQARDEIGAGELSAEQQERHPCTDHRDRLHDAAGDLQTGAGEQVVGQGVAGEAGTQSHRGEGDADDPVELTGLAESAGEEHAEHVDGDGADEDQCCPVMHLA